MRVPYDEGRVRGIMQIVGDFFVFLDCFYFSFADVKV